ncbi:glycosyltransferase [Sphingomonas bacterium]|uniref:glycosyltransferase n=1 Tax=Sphingomonas bacterium TaxID=1895847 RepID=UPI0015754DCA|nr:glycosyltransferase [Sphingomonas bacterium]
MPADHILTYVESLRGGGVERAQLRLAGGWLAAGRRVTLVANRLEGPLCAELPAGIETVTPRPRAVTSLLCLPTIVRQRKPDLIFCAGNTYTSIAAWTRARLGPAMPPIVGKVSNSLRRRDLGPLGDWGNSAWLACHGRFLDHLVAMTPETARRAERALRMRGRVEVIPNPPAETIPGAIGTALPRGRIVLGVGRLVAQKRWDRLIAALPLLADREVSLVIVGEGDRRTALEAQVAALGLGSRVFLPGHAADPLPVMARAAVVVLPSDFEGVPGVLREALSVGTPVIATESSPSVAEIVTSPTLGSIVAPDDPAALVAALDHWLGGATPRPAPVPQPGYDSAARYLALFDRLVVTPSRRPSRPAARTVAPMQP